MYSYALLCTLCTYVKGEMRKIKGRRYLPIYKRETKRADKEEGTAII